MIFDPPARARRLRRRDYALPSPDLAVALLGQRLVRITEAGERLAGIIVEAEAYLGTPDKGAHSYGGRRTERTEPMFGKPGTSYVYFTYGMHHCFNVAAGEEGDPVAVLVRALQPIEGLDQMRATRGRKPRKSPLRDADLCSGPGRLCEALGIDRRHTARDLASCDDLFIERTQASPLPRKALLNTPRIGLGSVEPSWALKPLRWAVKGNPHVSRGPVARPDRAE